MELISNISPVYIQNPATIIKILSCTIQFESIDEYAMFRVSFADSNGSQQTIKSVFCTKEEVDNWGEDDTTLIPFILEKLNLS